MIRGRNLYFVTLAGLMGLPLAAFAQPPLNSHSIVGVWENPNGTVKVVTLKCGVEVCGFVEWANDEAIKDAREGGTPRLIGIKLLKDYRQTAPNHWQGRVFVPDESSSYFSKIAQINPNAIKISGCLLGGWICKSQIWHRA